MIDMPNWKPDFLEVSDINNDLIGKVICYIPPHGKPLYSHYFVVSEIKGDKLICKDLGVSYKATECEWSNVVDREAECIIFQVERKELRPHLVRYILNKYNPSIKALIWKRAQELGWKSPNKYMSPFFKTEKLMKERLKANHPCSYQGAIHWVNEKLTEPYYAGNPAIAFEKLEWFHCVWGDMGLSDNNISKMINILGGEFNPNVKCLSIPQPFASLLVNGFKSYTVSLKPLTFNGFCLIHAARPKVNQEYLDRIKTVFKSKLVDKICDFNYIEMSQGRLVGYGYFYQGLSGKQFRSSILESKELQYADFGDLDNVWLINRTKAFKGSAMLPVRGGNEFFDCDENTLKQLLELKEI